MRLGDYPQEIYHGFAVVTIGNDNYSVYERERTDEGWCLGKFRVSLPNKRLALEWIDIESMDKQEIG